MYVFVRFGTFWYVLVLKLAQRKYVLSTPQSQVGMIETVTPSEGTLVTSISEGQKGSGRRWSANFCPNLGFFLKNPYAGILIFGKFGKPLLLDPFWPLPNHSELTL